MNTYFYHILLLLKKLGIALLLFSLSRIIFLLFNTSHFSDVSISLFFYGIRFDLVAISYFFAPLIFLQLIPFPVRDYKWYNKVLSVAFYIGITTTLILNMIDVSYFDYTLKRSTADLFGIVSVGNDFLNLLPNYIIDYWYSYILLVALIFIPVLLHKKYCTSIIQKTSYNLKTYLSHSLIFILFIGITILGMRGGTQLKPLSILNAGQYAKSQNISIVLNTPFTILKTILKDNLEIKDYFAEKEIETIFSPNKKIVGQGIHEGKNVVLIIMESFAKEYVGGLNDGLGYTPFIDSLLDKSYVFTNAYANSSRSIEALPCMLSGLPQLMSQPYALSTYAGNQITGLPQHLKNDGYNTSFYHGGANGTMGFNGFVGVIGVDNYFGLNEYPDKEKDYDGAWGIFDEPYLQYYAKELNAKPEPFFSSVFTLSSHHPYTIPEQHKGKFPKGDLPLHQTVGYTDYALKQFFKLAKGMPWFKNTLFVFTADHSAQSNSSIYKTRMGRYAVPFFIYSPSGNLKGKHTDLFQHIDVTPTLLGLVSKNNKIISFGNDAFGISEKYTVQFINNTYQISVNNSFLIFDGITTVHYSELINGSLLYKNIINGLTSEQTIKKNKVEKLLKGIIQQYNNRLINNQLNVLEK